MVKTKVWKIEDGVVRVVDMNKGDVVNLPADTVILAGGLKPQTIELGDIDAEVHVIGDANQPGKIVNAIMLAYSLAREI